MAEHTKARPVSVPVKLGSPDLDMSSISSIDTTRSLTGLASPEDSEDKKEHDPKNIKSDHVLFQLSFAMMTGIRTCVSMAYNTKHAAKLEDTEFMRIDHVEFPPEGSKTTPPTGLKTSFIFKDYSPIAFQRLRQLFHIETADYMNSLCGDLPYVEFISNSKSGQFFFFSYDQRYMIKTQSKVESKFLRRIVPHYYRFVMKNPGTLITRFYGMHRVNMKPYKAMHFVIMGNFFFTEKPLHTKYDLKGSSAGREASEKEKAKPDCVFKDNDLRDGPHRLRIGKSRKAGLISQLRKDAAFLASLQIMDYSLLLGIHEKSKADKEMDEAAIKVDETDADVKTMEPVMSSLVVKSPAARGSIPIGPPGLEDAVSLEDIPIHGLSTTGASGVSRARALSAIREKKSKLTLRRLQSRMSVAGASKLLEIPTAAMPTAGLEKISEGESIVDEGLPGLLPDGTPSGDVYFMGIIDILQQYNAKKSVETLLRSFVTDVSKISSVDPKRYAKRFVDFIDSMSEE